MIEKLKHSRGEEPEKPILLVVEDDSDMLRLIYLELKDSYQVLTAANGREGMGKALETIPDLVITDLMMPVMDGIELCQKLKEHMHTSHIPVIMLTAKSSVGSQIEGLGVGADDYVTKPFNMILLKARVHNLLETRRFLREKFRRLARRVAPQKQEEGPGKAGFNLFEKKDFHGRLDHEFWDAMCRVVEQSYQDPEFSVELLALQLDMSERSVQRKIKAMAGLTPVQLIGECRLKKAAALLRDPSTQVTDIAFQVGFGDLSHFYRVFKKQFGMSPARYRAENQ